MNQVGTLAQQRLITSYMQLSQSRISTAQQQVGSGKTSTDYAGIAPDSRRLVTLKNLTARAEQYSANNKLVDSRLQVMETNTAAVFDIASRLRTLLVNGLNAGNAEQMAIAEQADHMLQQVSGLLNAQREDRYLFGGSRTDIEPVDLSDLPDQTDPVTRYTIPSATGSALGYYKGDTVRQSVQADDDLTVTYGVSADDPAFEATIRALHLVATVTSPATEGARLEEALRVVNEAIEELPDVRTRIGAARRTLEDATTRHTDYILYSQQSISEIEDVDIAQTVSKLSQEQTMLEASYLTISRIAQMTLLDFIR